MQMSTVKKIGWRHYTFTVEGQTLYDCVTESQKLSFPDVQKCGLCQEDNLILSAHEAQGYQYTVIKCLACRGDVTFGKRKDSPDTFFIRRNESGGYDWKAFVPKDGGKGEQKKPAPAPAPAGGEDNPDLPF